MARPRMAMSRRTRSWGISAAMVTSQLFVCHWLCAGCARSLHQWALLGRFAPLGFISGTPQTIFRPKLASSRKKRSMESPVSSRSEPVDVGVTQPEVSGGSSTSQAAAIASVAGLSKAAQQKTSLQTLAAGVTGALLFCGYVYYSRGVVPATEWLSCYVIEYSLSIDNLFVFIIIFKYFKVPEKLQSNVLNLGIAGAIIFRFVFVYLGAIVLQQFEFLILGFSAILIYASYQGFTKGDDDDDDDDENLDNNFIVNNLRAVLNVSPKFDGDKYFSEVDGQTFVTPLLLCLLTIEFSDIVFATDSVPAVLGTTQDQFIAYSSNIFAVFGLRSLFFLLQEAIVSFSKLETAVNFVLGFIGVKIVLDFFEIVQIDVVVSLAIVLGTLVAGVVASLSEMGEETGEAS
mmetsp:Transcript_130375/g.260070  ORF Transcript_130375/g.260070 Transcript_130375/m.260070 type:complete len:402 (-) Transcript_130375:69-1274(-)